MELHEYEDLNQTVVPKGAKVFRCCEDVDVYLVFTMTEAINDDPSKLVKITLETIDD